MVLGLASDTSGHAVLEKKVHFGEISIQFLFGGIVKNFFCSLFFAKRSFFCYT